MSQEVLVWLDLEMTGLSEHDEIIEVACVLTDMDYNQISDDFTRTVHVPLSKLEGMSDVCTQMHQASGLWEDVLKSTNDIARVERDLVTEITNATSSGTVLYLAGNSIHVDRTFVKKQMPLLDKLLHYRMLDVTAVGMFLKNGFSFPDYIKSKNHRALDDIKESIGEVTHYHKWVVKGHAD